jgi:hypothetical protein
MTSIFKPITNAEAIKITDQVVSEMTPERAYQLFKEECEGDLTMLNMMIWNHYGLGGHYYDSEKSIFCNDVIFRSIIDNTIKLIKNK